MVFPEQVRHRVSNWSGAAVGGPGYGDSGLWLVVAGAWVQLYREGAIAGEQPFARLDLYTIQSWRGTPTQLHLQLIDGQVVSFDVDGGGYGVVRELEHVCQTLATQQPVLATAVDATVVGTGPTAQVTTGAVDTSAIERGIAGCVARLQEQMSLRWLAVSAEIARLRTAAEAMAASASMLDHLASTAPPEDSVCLDTAAGTDSAAGGSRGVCSACTFENESNAEQCEVCGCSLGPVAVSIQADSSSGSSAAADLVGAVAVLREAVEAEDVSWLVGALTSLQAEGGAVGGSGTVTADRLATMGSLARWLEAAEERCLAWRCVGESLRAGEREELELWMEMLAEASATTHAENIAAGGATSSSTGEPVLRVQVSNDYSGCHVTVCCFRRRDWRRASRDGAANAASRRTG